MTRAFIAFLFAISAYSQTYTPLAYFGGETDTSPSALVQGSDGSFYGTTRNGGQHNNGSVFKITATGAFTTLYSFSAASTDGSAPMTGLLAAADGNLYGTTSAGGSSNLGTIFKITPTGALTTLANFDAVTGGHPTIPLIQDAQGRFWGATSQGGDLGGGGVFLFVPPNKLTVDESVNHPLNSLIVGNNGILYGSNDEFGANASGAVFSIDDASTRYDFGSKPRDGIQPNGIVQGADGNLYGATRGGGAFQQCLYGCGIVFQVDLTGHETILHSFGGSAADGNNPEAGLVLGSDGNFYGTTFAGGDYSCPQVGCGAIFQITPAGVETILYRFRADGSGNNPATSLIQASDGNLYGTTLGGGTDGREVVFFKLTLPQPNAPAIAASNGVLNGASFQPGISPDGWVTINGTNLATKTDSWTIVNGALPTSLDGVSVTIGGQPAYIEYISPIQINAIAPDVAAGSVPVIVTNANGASAPVNAELSAEAPAFFQWGNYAVATQQDFSPAVKNGTFSITTTPAKPGDVIILWGTGFGATSPPAPAGKQTPSDTTYNTAAAVKVTVGGKTATVYGAALAPGYAGLYQIAIQIPALPDGDYSVVATVNHAPSPSSTAITVQR